MEVAVNDAAEAPAGTVTDAGTVSAAALSDRATVVALAAAAPSVTVQFVPAPPLMADGLHAIEDNPAAAGAFTVTTAVFETPFSDAVMVTFSSAVTTAARMENEAEVAPAGTVTDNGVAIVPELSVSVTIAPPEGAALLKVTEQVTEESPAIVAGHCNDDSVPAAGAASCSVAVLETPFSEAVTVADAFDATCAALTVNVAWLDPALIFTVAGTVRLLLLSETATVSPPAGALPLSATVQFEVPGVVIEAGLHTSELSVTEGGGATALTTPVEPEIGTADPSGSAPIADTFRLAEVSADVVVTLIVASTPLLIGVELRPTARQV